MPLRVWVTEPQQPDQLFDLESGPLEFGRGPKRDATRCVLFDPTVSRDQLRIEALTDGRLRVENLSASRPVLRSDGLPIGAGQRCDLDLPATLTVAGARIVVDHVAGATAASVSNVTTGQAAIRAPESRDDAGAQPPVRVDAVSAREGGGLEAMVEIEPSSTRPRSTESTIASGEMPTGQSVDYLAHWVETVADLQNPAIGSADFYRMTAEALVRLVGLDYGLVLLRQDDTWTVAGSAAAGGRTAGGFSRSLVAHVATHRRSIYRDLNLLRADAASMVDIDAAVVSPIFGLQDNVVGVLYGVRNRKGMIARGHVTSQESRLAQLLAGAVGAHLVRSVAARTRVQFEQFFSPDLVRELERDPGLLEGRFGEVTVLFSDLRGFTALSERLGAEKTCRMLRDMMECLSTCIVDRGGAIVDYAGDGILAMWNAPVRQPDHAVLACGAALAMLAELPALNARWAEDAGGSLALGIGVNTGEAQVGNTGSSRKFKYGPHGHAVNLASRIQDATKTLGLPLLIAALTRDALPAAFSTRRVGRVRLPGVAEPVGLYELHGEHAGQDWTARRDIYERALSLYEEGHWSEACQAAVPLLSAVDATGGYDTPTLKLIRRAWECLETRPSPFDPIIDVGKK